MSQAQQYIDLMSGIDEWNTGALDGCRGAPAKSASANYLDGYRHGQDERRVRAVLPPRPEGYYHAPIGNFD